jgi:hypothetical protein
MNKEKWVLTFEIRGESCMNSFNLIRMNSLLFNQPLPSHSSLSRKVDGDLLSHQNPICALPRFLIVLILDLCNSHIPTINSIYLGRTRSIACSPNALAVVTSFERG